MEPMTDRWVIGTNPVACITPRRHRGRRQDAHYDWHGRRHTQFADQVAPRKPTNVRWLLDRLLKEARLLELVQRQPNHALVRRAVALLEDKCGQLGHAGAAVAMLPNYGGCPVQTMGFVPFLIVDERFFA